LDPGWVNLSDAEFSEISENSQNIEPAQARNSAGLRGRKEL
jgi:hypothetical protein